MEQLKQSTGAINRKFTIPTGYLFTGGEQWRLGLKSVPDNATPKRVAKLIREYVKKYDTQ